MAKVITIFEHGKLEVGTIYGKEDHSVCFTERHFDALVRHNERCGYNLFEIGHSRIVMKQYVGVIAVDDITIEILPKADAIENTRRWRNALINMLKVAHELPLHDAGHAHLRLRNTSVLEHFLQLFVREVQTLVHRGLVKQYRQRKGLQFSLKGRLDLPRHIQQSTVSRERFAVIHQSYDTNHVLHAILKKALGVVKSVTRDGLTQALVHDVECAFESVDDRPGTSEVIKKIRLGRKTRAYSEALQLAKLILLNFTPDVRQGREHILSLLFDMNALFEVVVLRLMQKAARSRPGLAVTGQNRQHFWNGQHIRPDIVIRNGDGNVCCIVDTKWKVPRDNRPADADLKQVFAYNLQFASTSSILAYPGSQSSDTALIAFEPSAASQLRHSVGLRFLEIFDENGHLRTDSVSCILDAVSVSPSLLAQ